MEIGRKIKIIAVSATLRKLRMPISGSGCMLLIILSEMGEGLILVKNNVKIIGIRGNLITNATITKIKH